MIQEFLQKWFPKTEKWNNLAKFITESGIEIVEDKDLKWLPGYTNISVCHKPHHEDWYVRYMEENMFMLHDCVHQIFTMNIGKDVTEAEYVLRQIYGELYTFFLTEYEIPKVGKYDYWKLHKGYLDYRGCYKLMECMDWYSKEVNIIDFMYQVFVEGVVSSNFLDVLQDKELTEVFDKYAVMFKEDVENSKINYQSIKNVNLPSYCMNGATSKNHILFLEAIGNGAVKNIKRDFNLVLPDIWK